MIERNFGSFDGLVVKEVKQKHGVPLDQPSNAILPADADHWAEIHERAPRTIAKWLDAQPGETLLFVAHGGIFDGLHHHLIGPRAGAESQHATPYIFAHAATGWSIAEIA